jgi:hypothetical protein
MKSSISMSDVNSKAVFTEALVRWVAIMALFWLIVQTGFALDGCSERPASVRGDR